MMEIQNATKDDAGDLAHLINLAGEGIPEYLWSAMIEGEETAFDVGVRRAQREEGGFSYTKARVVRKDGEVAGMIIAYPLDDPYELGDLEDYPEVVRPLVKLEAQAPGSWYVNALATKARFRGQGIATTLLREAEQQAAEKGVSTMSLIVASENTTARALYLKLGYRFVTSLPVVRVPSLKNGGHWELLIKQLF